MEYIWGVGLLMNFMKEDFFKKGIKDGLKRVYSRQMCVLFKSHLLINLVKITTPVFYSRESSRLFESYFGSF